MSDSWLHKINEHYRVKAISDEERRKAFSDELEKIGPVHFVADPDDPKQGVGWFRAEGGFVAYTKYANGYSIHRSASLTTELVMALAKDLDK
jgi:hypothetical protein